MSKRLRRPTPAFVVAVLALAVALGGTSFAADPIAQISALINGKKIKKNSIPGNRLKKNTVTGREVNESKLGKVKRATQADNAARLGLTPASGYQTFATRTIPKGTTVTGAFGFQTNTGGGTSSSMHEVYSFPGKAPADLSDTQVNFAPAAGAGDADATCKGTADNPTAPAGKVCLYLTAGVGLNSTFTGEAIPLSNGSRFGFNVAATQAASGTGVYGTWAYTAP